jgi:hypothetical protein
VDDRFKLGGFSFGEIWVTGSSSEFFCWRDVGDRFGSGQFSSERCGRLVRVGSDFVR